MKTFLATLTACLAILATGVLALLGWQSHQNRQLTTTNAQLMQELNRSHEAVTALTQEKAGISEKLAALELMETELRERVDSLEASAKSANDATPRPYRVRAFVGRDNVGQAWIIPHNVTRDTESGRYMFEPVLVIDEAAKRHFTEHHTNVVEREVYTTQIYQDGYRYPYYYSVAPRRPGKPGRPPVKPEPPIAPQPSETRTVSQPDINARMFAPPNSIVTSRPQVLGTPATAPVNARVFAP
jgi:hypothetical protein